MNKSLILSLILSVLFFSACNTPEKSPGEVAVELYTALTSGDAQAVKDNMFISDSIYRNSFFAYLDIAVASEQYKQNTANFKAAYVVSEEDVNGDEATVVLTGKGPLGQNVRITVKLLLIDGAWKVDGEHGVWQ